MSEPDYIAQCGEPLTGDERRKWISDACEDGHLLGCTHFRASVHETIPDLIMVEGWKVRPDDQGEQRWALTANGTPIA